MANYIDKEIICEAYSHLESTLFNDKEELNKVEKHLKIFFEERARFLFGEDVEIEIEFSDGSLISKLKVIGSTSLILGTLVSDYGSFRSGVDQIARDSSLLAQSTNLEVIFRTRTNYCDRIAVEKRQGIFGRTRELIYKLDNIKSQLDDSQLPTNQASLEIFHNTLEELLNWDKSADKLFNKMSSSETVVCIASGLADELTKLPEATPWEKDLESSSLRSTIVSSDPKLSGEVSGASSRYNATIKSILKKMNDRMLTNADSKA